MNGGRAKRGSQLVRPFFCCTETLYVVYLQTKVAAVKARTRSQRRRKEVSKQRGSGVTALGPFRIFREFYRCSPALAQEGAKSPGERNRHGKSCAVRPANDRHCMRPKGVTPCFRCRDRTFRYPQEGLRQGPDQRTAIHAGKGGVVDTITDSHYLETV